MTWWRMITTKGRLLDNFRLTFADGEIWISCVTLEAGEQMAVLIDRLNNKARLYAPVDECRRLASRHQYELVDPVRHGEAFRNWLRPGNQHSAVSLQPGTPLA